MLRAAFRRRGCSKSTVSGSSAWSISNVVAPSKKLGKRLQEQLVLVRRAVCDAQRAFAAERRPGADEHTALAQPLDDGLLVAPVAERKPAEVGLRFGRIEAERAQSLIDG